MFHEISTQYSAVFKVMQNELRWRERSQTRGDEGYVTGKGMWDAASSPGVEKGHRWKTGEIQVKSCSHSYCCVPLSVWQLSRASLRGRPGGVVLGCVLWWCALFTAALCGICTRVLWLEACEDLCNSAAEGPLAHIWDSSCRLGACFSESVLPFVCRLAGFWIRVSSITDAYKDFRRLTEKFDSCGSEVT